MALRTKLFVQLGLVQGVRAVRLLDAVHRDVCVADEVLAARLISAADRDADAHVAGDVAAPERVRPVERFEHPPGRSDRSLRVRVADEHGELVAAEPRGGVARAQAAVQA